MLDPLATWTLPEPPASAILRVSVLPGGSNREDLEPGPTTGRAACAASGVASSDCILSDGGRGGTSPQSGRVRGQSAAFAQQLGVRIAGGEQLETVREMQTFLEHDALDGLQPPRHSWPESRR